MSYFNGEASISPFFWTSENTLLAVARLLRKFHDATVDLPFGEFHWVQSHPDQTQHEVICHNDFGPYNIVCSNELPVGIIDFDLAGPGPRNQDVAYALYWLSPMSLASEDRVKYTAEQFASGCSRAKLFCSVYGIEYNETLIEKVSEVLSNMGNKERAVHLVGSEAADRLERDGHLDHWATEHMAFEANKHRFLAST